MALSGEELGAEVGTTGDFSIFFKAITASGICGLGEFASGGTRKFSNIDTFYRRS